MKSIKEDSMKSQFIRKNGDPSHQKYWSLKLSITEQGTIESKFIESTNKKGMEFHSSLRNQRQLEWEIVLKRVSL
jgi:hypothetical protein